MKDTNSVLKEIDRLLTGNDGLYDQLDYAKSEVEWEVRNAKIDVLERLKRFIMEA